MCKIPNEVIGKSSSKLSVIKDFNGSNGAAKEEVDIANTPNNFFNCR